MMSEEAVRMLRQQLLEDANREMRARAEVGLALDEAEMTRASAMIAALTGVLEDGDTFQLDWPFLDIVS